MSGLDAGPGDAGVPAAGVPGVPGAGGERAQWRIRLETKNARATQAVGAELGRQLRRGDLLVLTGELGAGKTTFTQGLGTGLGVRQGIISPTFVLVRIHPNTGSGPGAPDLVHVDAYRLGSAAEIDDIDLENTMDSAVTVVEWGRGRVEHLAASRLEIELQRGRGQNLGSRRTGSFQLNFEEQDDDEPRAILITGYGPRWAGAQPSLTALSAGERRGAIG